MYHDGEPLWYRTMEDLLGKQPVLGLVPHNLEAELADLPRGHRTITLKWVFKPKRDEAGAIIKHKARLVARGFVQQEGFDFDDAFAPPSTDGVCATPPFASCLRGLAHPPHGGQVGVP